MKVWQVYVNDSFESAAVGTQFATREEAITHAHGLNHAPGRPAFCFYEVKEEEPAMKQLTPNTFLLADGVIVHKTNLIGTNHWVFTAWKPVPGITGHDENHCSNITSGLDWQFHTDDGGVQWYGRMGTECLSAYLNSLKGEERYARVSLYQENRWQQAYQTILSVFPEAANGKRDMGDISLTIPA